MLCVIQNFCSPEKVVFIVALNSYLATRALKLSESMVAKDIYVIISNHRNRRGCGNYKAITIGMRLGGFGIGNNCSTSQSAVFPKRIFYLF